jgi:hypothetical protein
VVHTCDPSPQEAEVKAHLFETSLNYIAYKFCCLKAKQKSSVAGMLDSLLNPRDGSTLLPHA